VQYSIKLIVDPPSRVAAVSACKWSSLTVPSAPFVTSSTWLDHFGTYFVVHGDDITLDSSGEDCNRFVKDAGRFKAVTRKQGPRGISTTDLIDRILLGTKRHHLSGGLSREIQWLKEECGNEEDRQEGFDMEERLRLFAVDEGGWNIGSTVWEYTSGIGRSPACFQVVDGPLPDSGQRVIYVNGGFDLFCPGHIEFLRLVMDTEAQENGGIKPFVVAGVYDDATINGLKGRNYPLMNLFERTMLAPVSSTYLLLIQ
jgi:ethanolamine-phosphate cytidylyltransferase